MIETHDGIMHTNIDSLLNDSEINIIADLFLACFEFDRGTQSYRTFKNTVILMSRGIWSLEEVYRLLSECCDKTAQTVKRDVINIIRSTERPMHELFNNAYAPKDAPFDRHPLSVTMSDSPDPEYVVGFLGTVLLYLIITNYPKYDSVRK